MYMKILCDPHSGYVHNNLVHIRHRWTLFFWNSDRFFKCDRKFEFFGTAPLRSGGSFRNVACQPWWHMPQGLILCMCNSVIFLFHPLSHYLTEMVLPNFCSTLCTTASLLYRCHCSLFLSPSLSHMLTQIYCFTVQWRNTSLDPRYIIWPEVNKYSLRR